MFEIKRSLAIIIGIDRYRQIPPLKNAVADAVELAGVLKDIYGYEVLLLLNQRATTTELNKLLKALQNKTIPLDERSISVSNSDRILFYFAGHGFAKEAEDDENGKPHGYFMPQDAEPNNSDTWLSMQRLYEAFSGLDCHHLLMILDCCFAGRISWLGGGRNAARSRKMYRQSYDRFIKHKTEQIITSAAYDEEAQDLSRFGERGERNGHSPFADLLLKVLQYDIKGDLGKDKFLDGIVEDRVITVHELFTYLQNKLGEVATRQTPGLSQPRKYDRKTGEYVYLKGEYIFPFPGFAPEQLQKLKLDRNSNPYKGLSAFDTRDSYLFFGRKTLSQQLSKILQWRSLTIVLGASGSGKSSLVKAGVIPILRGECPQQQWHILEPMRPGEFPFKALHNILKVTELDDFSRISREQSGILFDKIGDLIKSHAPAKLLITVDQAEELLTICDDEKERKAFLDLLVRLLRTYPQLRIILTLRSDFEPQLRDAITEFNWQKAWQQGRFFVTPMNREELQQAIEEPAAQRTLFFESPKLVDRLIDEVINTPGALPLLSFTLSELYLKYLQGEEHHLRDNRIITEADYQELGGVARSLTQAADRSYLNLIEVEKVSPATIGNVLLRMVSLSGGELARRRVLKSELIYPEPQNEQVQQVINCFVAARLLTTGLDLEGKEYVEPVHDVLITGWHKLLSWKQEKEASLVLQRRLTVAAEEWNQLVTQTQPSGFLAKCEPFLDRLDRLITRVENRFSQVGTRFVRWWRDAQKMRNPITLTEKPQQFLWNSDPYLDVLYREFQSQENWFNRVEGEFLQQSFQQKRLNISWRWRIAIGVILSLSTLFVAAMIFLGLSRINQARVLRESAEISLQENQSLDGMSDILQASQILERPGLQLLLFVKQLFSQQNLQEQVRGTLLRAIYTVKESDRQQRDRGTVRASFSPYGTKIISAGENGIVRLWNLQQQNLDRQISLPCSEERCEPLKIARFSPNEEKLATAGTKGTIRVWQVRDRQLTNLKQWNTGQEEVKNLSFSPDSQLLATTGANGKIILWDLEHNPIKQVKTFCLLDFCSQSSYGVVWSVAFSPDGQKLVYAGENGIIRLWQRENELWREQGQFAQKSDEDVTSLSFSPDSQTLASTGQDGIIRLWDLSDRNSITQLREITTEQQKIWEVSFSPDGKKLSSAGDNSTIVIWDLATQNIESESLVGHKGPVRSTDFSPDGRQILSAGDDGSVRLWNLQGNELKQFPVTIEEKPHKDEIIITKGQQQAFGEEDGTIKWQNSPNEPIVTMKSNHVGAVTSLAFSPDGKQLVSGGNDSTIRLWKQTGEQEYLLPTYAEVNSVAYSPDRHFLASAGEDGMLQLWDLRDLEAGKPFAAWKAYLNSVERVQFTQDGRFLETIGEESNTQLYKKWSIESLDNAIDLVEKRLKN